MENDVRIKLSSNHFIRTNNDYKYKKYKNNTGKIMNNMLITVVIVMLLIKTIKENYPRTHSIVY
jgi:hypothetical protein